MKKRMGAFFFVMLFILNAISIPVSASDEPSLISDLDTIMKIANIYMAEHHIRRRTSFAYFTVSISSKKEFIHIGCRDHYVEETYAQPLLEYLYAYHVDPKVIAGGTHDLESGGVEYDVELPNYTLGDFNDDSAVTAEDAQLALAAYAEKCAGKAPEWTEVQKAAYDPDCDDELTAADAQFILQYYVSNTVAGIPTTWVDIVVFGK